MCVPLTRAAVDGTSAPRSLPSVLTFFSTYVSTAGEVQRVLQAHLGRVRHDPLVEAFAVRLLAWQWCCACCACCAELRHVEAP